MGRFLVLLELENWRTERKYLSTPFMKQRGRKMPAGILWGRSSVWVQTWARECQLGVLCSTTRKE